MFRAVAWHEMGSEEGHGPLRRRVVAELRGNPGAYAHLLPGGVDAALRADCVAQQGAPGTLVEVAALAVALLPLQFM